MWLRFGSNRELSFKTQAYYILIKHIILITHAQVINDMTFGAGNNNGPGVLKKITL